MNIRYAYLLSFNCEHSSAKCSIYLSEDPLDVDVSESHLLEDSMHHTSAKEEHNDLLFL